MNQKEIPGTKGYADLRQSFIDATLAIDFLTLHRDFVPFFPAQPARILDVGAGIGRDAAAFARMGHSVTAIEPLAAFRTAGQQLYEGEHVHWLDDALPELTLLNGREGQADFILASGIWHHLDTDEQQVSLQRIAALLSKEGTFALTLRNGPAGVGTHVFPADGPQTIKNAEHFGLKLLLLLEHQPSLMKNKEQVSWTKMVFRK